MAVIVRLVLLTISAADPHCDPQRPRQITYFCFTPKLPRVDVLIGGLLLVFLRHARDSLQDLSGIRDTLSPVMQVEDVEKRTLHLEQEGTSVILFCSIFTHAKCE